MDKFYRKASPNERVYIASQSVFSPLNIQCVFEGEGKLDLERVKEAVRKASDVCPGSKLVYKAGKWYETEFYPKVDTLYSETFDGYNFEVLGLAQKSFDIRVHPPIEVLLLKGKTKGLIFRIFHGIMDGKGALLWIENVFKALRNEPLTHLDNRHTDLSFLKTQKYKKFSAIGKPQMRVSDTCEKFYKNVKTKRVTIQGDYNSLLAKIAKVLTDHFEPSSSIFMVPVSLRSLDQTLLTTANMVLPIFLHVTKGQSYKTISSQLINRISRNEHLNLNNAQLGILAYMPDLALKGLLKGLGGYCNYTKSYFTSGTLSYVGKYNTNIFSTPKFRCKTFYSMPLCTPFSPISLVMYKNEHSVEVSMSYYDCMISEEKMNLIINDLTDEIREIKAYKILNETQVSHPKMSLSQVFNQALNQNKNKIALIDKKSQITYGQLGQKVDLLVKNWKGEGHSVPCEALVYEKRSIDFIVQVLACIKLEIPFIPVDPDDVSNYDKNFLESFTGCFLKTRPATKPSLADGTAYRIYTSGTTGKPKGINISRKNIKNYLFWAKNAYKIEKTDSFALFTSLSVDLTITTYLLPLICGASIYIYKDKFNTNIAKDLVENEAVTCLKMTPTHLKLINQLGNVSWRSGEKKCLILGGEQVTFNQLLKAQTLFGRSCTMVNEYGPTETTIGSSAFIMEADFLNQHPDKSGVVPIGKPIDNTQIRIVNSHGDLVKLGQSGEIHIGGAGVCLGYEIEPSQDCFYTIQGKKIYKTGDIGYLSEKGNLYYEARADRQVKINGKRIELSSIEYILNQYSDQLRFYLVFDHEEKELYTFIAENNNETVEIEEIHKYALLNLPKFIRPKFIVLQNDLPLTKSGKLDEKTLIEWGRLYNRPYIESQTLSPLEEEVLTLFSLYLEIDKSTIKKTDKFFSLGGDSLDYIRLTGAIMDKFIDMENRDHFMGML